MERYILANLDRMFGGKNKMKCTNKQQETCDVEKRTCKGCYYNDEGYRLLLSIKNEKTADEMFEELGYIKESDYYYHSKDEATIHKHIKFYKEHKEFIVESKLRFSYEITMQELQAINKKCEEMRMDLIKKWKEIKGFEGRYIISNYGEIISLPRFKQNNSKLQYVEPKEICKYINKKNGYVYVFLCNNGKDKNFRLHRIVAETFLENSNNLPQVNHKDGDKTNNRVDNLEWCTASHNLLHAYKLGLANNDKRKIKIGQYSMDGQLLKTFNSLTEASKITGVNIQKISLCINNKYKYRNKREKYIWRKI